MMDNQTFKALGGRRGEVREFGGITLYKVECPCTASLKHRRYTAKAVTERLEPATLLRTMPRLVEDAVG